MAHNGYHAAPLFARISCKSANHNAKEKANEQVAGSNPAPPPQAGRIWALEGDGLVGSRGLGM